jgi:hypothetical protein
MVLTSLAFSGLPFMRMLKALIELFVCWKSWKYPVYPLAKMRLNSRYTSLYFFVLLTLE